jgi:predicted RNase H-like nuclease
VDVLGVDACGKQGWVAVRLTDGAYAGSLVDLRLDRLIGRADATRAVHAVAVDMPLGLVERGWRAADLMARSLLGPRRHSVFPVAPRAAWEEREYTAAADRCQELTGSRLSRQAWALRPKLLEARACRLADERLHEVHPELSFRALAGGVPASHSKKTWRGQHQRRSLLTGAGLVLPEELGEADGVPVDDVLDAADFVRAGRDLFVTRSNVTNLSGIEWLRRHLGPGYRIHEIESRCRTPMHIDTTFMVLAPGKALVNPDYIDVDRLPDVLRSWDILVAPEPDPIRDPLLRLTSLCGKWLSLNVLMVDEKRVIAERHHTGMLRALERWGFEPIPCDLLHYAPFGGSFHCATLDVRRRGTLQSYF